MLWARFLRALGVRVCVKRDLRLLHSPGPRHSYNDVFPGPPMPVQHGMAIQTSLGKLFD